MNDNNVKEIELSSVLDMVTYIDNTVTDDMKYHSLQEIYTQAVKNNEDMLKSGAIDGNQYHEWRVALDTIGGALEKHPEWRDVKMLDKSKIEPPGTNTDKWTDDYIQACTFKDADGNIIVSYRGTGNGRWRDNGEGLVSQSTEMQRAAQEYFDSVVERYGLEEAHAQGKKIMVSGHSKGGNEAQYVYMESKYEHLIDNCYSFDGQGFSEFAIADFKSKYSEDYYNLKLKNMYSVNGDNDYVHDLGLVIIPEENTYYLHTTGNGIAEYHDLNYVMCDYERDENGNIIVEPLRDKEGKIVYDKDGKIIEVKKIKYSGLKWDRSKDGSITHGEQGPLGKLAKKLSERVMALDPENRRGVTVAMMDLLQGGHANIGGTEVDFWDKVEFWAYGVPLLMDTLLRTEEGREAIKHIIITAVHDYYADPNRSTFEKVAVTILAVLVAPTVIVIAGALLGAAEVILSLISWGAQILDGLHDMWVNFVKFTEKVLGFLNDIKNAIVDFFAGIGRWFFEQSAGYRYASNNPYVQLDTAVLRRLATRLESVNRKIRSIDSQMDSLYHKLSLIEDFKLQKADMMTKESSRIWKCINYLNQTASDFEDVENYIGGIEGY